MKTNLESSNEPRDTRREHKPNTLTLDQTALKRWLTTEVDLTLPRWAIVAAGLVTFLLLLIALD